MDAGRILMPNPYNPWAEPIFPQGAAFGAGSPAEAAQQPAGLSNFVGGIYGMLGDLAKRAVGNSQTALDTGNYNPAPVLEAAMLPMGTGAIAGVPVKGAEAVLGAGPIRAYHRSPNNFDKFDLSYTGSTTDPGQLGTGHYFSTDANVASGGPHRYEATVDLKNPIELQYPNWGADKQALITEHLGLPLDAHAQDIRLAALNKGHDGVVLDYSPVGYNQKEVAAYHDHLINIMRKYAISGMMGAPIFANAVGENKQ